MKFMGTIAALSLFLISMGAIAQSDHIVLVTYKSKDPFSSYPHPIVYVKQALTEAEARQAMLKQWKGPAAVTQGEAAASLMIYRGPLMTRKKFVDETLAAFKKQGGNPADLRVDDLPAR